MSIREINFVPLGGAGEIGMNMSLYGYRDRWIMVDMGISFADDSMPGIDLLTPDPTFAEGLGDRLEGIIITHAHEDHLGAVPYLCSRFDCPIYATPFASELLQRKLQEGRNRVKPKLVQVRNGGSIELGPFTVGLIPAAHSVPETHILEIRTELGTVIHASDWKLDPEPLVGERTNAETLSAAGERGVLALVCDSTNAFEEGTAGSEADLRKNLIDIIGGCRGRVGVASFASNATRIETVNHASVVTGRAPALIGRSLWRILEISRSCGYLSDIASFIPEEEVRMLPRDKLLACITGSQGEPGSALSRIAAGRHPSVAFEAGDTVIFSSREIPGNELAIGRVQNQLARLGVNVITEKDEFVHVSGHPARDELIQMYRWVRPQILVPIHGEVRHLQEHVSLANDFGIPQTAIAENGVMLGFSENGVRRVDEVTAGRLAVDGGRLVAIDSTIVRDRNRLRFNGVAMATVVLDRDGRLLGDPQLSVPGILGGEEDDETWEDALDEVIKAIDRLSSQRRADDEIVTDTTRRALGRFLRQRMNKRPYIEVHVVRV